MLAADVKEELAQFASDEKAQASLRYFKTGPGEYGQGDVFIGLKMGEQRKIAKKHRELVFDEIQKLLDSPIHEHRMTGLLILLYRYKQNRRKEIVDFYLDNTQAINNWDLVDVTAPGILGDWLLDKDRKILYDFAVSDDLWKKRIAIVATHACIRNGEFKDTLRIAELLLGDDHDLIHKAVGWMLREIGKKDQNALETFLKEHVSNMPRTTLRYAIERFEEKKRKHYLNLDK